jgi:GNAT superfamily N-acetyltransferase
MVQSGAADSIHGNAPWNEECENAWRQNWLAGSAHAWSRWAGTEMHGDLWSFIDQELAYVYGPYCNERDQFEHIETAYLHFESGYTLQRFRRQGVSRALVAAVAETGLPAWCQFATPFMEAVLDEATPKDEQERWEQTAERPAGGLAGLIEIGEDIEPEHLREQTIDLRILIKYPPAPPGAAIRNMDQADGEVEDEQVQLPETRREPDLREPPDFVRQWDINEFDWLVEDAVEETRLALDRARSGIAISNFDFSVLNDVAFGSEEPLRIELRLAGQIEAPALLEARASWRRYLTRFEEPWDPQTPEQAIAELLRSERFEVEQVTGE